MNFAKKLLTPLAVLSTVILATFIATVAPVVPEAKAVTSIAENYGEFVLWTNTIPTGSIITNTGHVNIDVDQGKVLVLFPTLVTTNASTSNVVFSFKTSLDGRTWSSTFTHSGTAAVNGTNPTTTAVIIGTNIQARFIAWDKVDAATALQTITISSLGYGWFPAIGR